MSYKYDLFISHASEDKDFVRPLAHALRAQRLAVWFDEFELTPGTGLRESIDRGLLSSRFGLVVLSPAFFSKSWPLWELDGLVQLAHSRSDKPTIIPIWHNVSHSDVASMSPSLANIIAINSTESPELAASQVLAVLRPRPTAVEVARDVLLDFGFPAPILSDDWWLDAAIWSAPQFGEGTFQEASSWGWWGFPLPSTEGTAESKGQRIAWAAMQHSWQETAVKQRITQCTHPDRVLEFIESQPGLAATAESHLDFLLSYVPQVGLPRCGGFLEPEIDAVFHRAESAIKANPGRGAPGWVLHDPDLCGMRGKNLVERYFWPMDPAGMSPEANVLAWIDAAAWIVSAASEWLPASVRTAMVEDFGSLPLLPRMRNGDADTWDLRESDAWRKLMLHGPDAKTQSAFASEARVVFEERIAVSCELHRLPEPASVLVERIQSWGIFEKYWVFQARPQF